MLAQRFAAAARSFEGVLFVPHGRDPQVGLDCVGLAIAAMQEAGGPTVDRSYALVPHGDLFAELEHALGEVLVRLPDGETWREGDVLALRYPPMYNHVAIYLGRDLIIHAYDHRAANRVVVTPVDRSIRRRVVSVWRVNE